MAGIRRFTSIKLEVPSRAVLRRLGWSKKETLLSPDEEREILAEARTAADSLDLTAAVFRTALAREGEGVLVVEGCRWESRDLARVLEGCGEVFLMAATGGGAFQEKLDGLMEAGRMRRAVIWNAAAGEVVDSVLDWLTALVSRELLREGRRTAKHRFSPGYGDFSLDCQGDLYRLLDLGALGISLTPAKLMVPEKSVTAVLGILEGPAAGGS